MFSGVLFFLVRKVLWPFNTFSVPFFWLFDALFEKEALNSTQYSACGGIDRCVTTCVSQCTKKCDCPELSTIACRLSDAYKIINTTTMTYAGVTMDRLHPSRTRPISRPQLFILQMLKLLLCPRVWKNSWGWNIGLVQEGYRGSMVTPRFDT